MILPFQTPLNVSPNHPANLALRFSWIANGTLAAYDAVIPGKGAVNGAPTVSFDPKLGTCVSFGSGGSDGFTFANRPTASEPQITIAAIVTVASITGGYQGLFTTTGNGSGGWVLVISPGPFFGLYKNGFSLITSGIAASANVPYLVIASSNATSGATNFLVKRLDTGVITTATASDTNTPGATDGTYVLGVNGVGSGQGANGKIAAILHNAQFMSLATMLAWAADPWGPWFNFATQRLFATLVGKTVVVTGTTPWPFFNMRAA